MNYVIQARDLTRTFRVGEFDVQALRGVSFEIEAGDFVAVMGSSGSGKSTLMNLLGCLDSPSTGQYLLDGERVDGLSRNRRALIRNHKIGFVFQGFNLLARTSALDNVELPLFYDRHDRIKNHRGAAADALARVGLSERMDHTPSQLSGGQQQRVAIARALVNQPSILLADEPTGNLDSRTSLEVISLFQQLNEEGVTVVLVTHEQELAQYVKRMIRLRDGLKVYDEPVRDRLLARDRIAGLTPESERVS